MKKAAKKGRLKLRNNQANEWGIPPQVQNSKKEGKKPECALSSADVLN